MINELETHIDVWDIIFVSEFDGTLSERDVSCSEGHYIFRHWPGHGSFASQQLAECELSWAWRASWYHFRLQVFDFITFML